MYSNSIIVKLFIALSCLGALFFCSCGSDDDTTFSNKDKSAKNYSENANQLKTNTTRVNNIESTSKALGKINYNVFIENSGSMDGYVNGGTTEFQQSVYNFLSDIRINKTTDSLNLFYVNSDIINLYSNATEMQIKDFIKKLVPDSFHQYPGNRTETELFNIIGRTTDYNPQSVIIIVSDFLFSPGRKRDASIYLTNQQIGFKGMFANKIDRFNISTTMVRFHSRFNGRYFDHFDDPIPINGVNGNYKRPFYAMLIGPDMALQATMGFILNDSNKYKERGYEEMWYFFNHSNNHMEPAARLSYKNRIGDFEIESPPTKMSITDACIDNDASQKNMKFRFSIAVDLRNIVRPEGYIIDTNNYEVTPHNYHIQIKSLDGVTDPSLKGATHLISVYTDEIKNVNDKVTVRLKNDLGKWINLTNVSSEDDSRIIETDDFEMRKTYGLKYLMTGIDDAYKIRNPDNNFLFSLDVNVAKAPTGYSGAIWAIVLLVLLVSGFFIFKTIKSR